MMKRELCVGIIDTMINIESSCFDGRKIRVNYMNEKQIEVKDNWGHGTAVASSILQQNKEVSVELFPLFSLKEQVEIDHIISTLEYIYYNKSEEIQLINMSMGITDAPGEKIRILEEICSKLEKKGVIIVAAFDNSGYISYPAAFPSVIGVDISKEVYSHGQFEYITNSIVNIRGCASPKRVIWNNNQRMIVKGSSFVTPIITALISQIMCKGIIEKQRVMDSLKDRAFRVRSFYKKKKRDVKPQFTVKKAIVLPFNKEIHSLVRYAEYFGLEIIDVYDIKHTMRIGKSVTEILNIPLKKDFIIKNIDMIEWTKEFDTVIIGHVQEIENRISRKNADNVLEMCRKYKKNVYMLDKTKVEKDNTVFSPCINWEDIPSENLGKMWRIQTPIVEVLGTRSQIGKYTLQQEIRIGMKKIGYNVGFLSSEPTGFLLQADGVFPYGYNSSVAVNEDMYVPIINQMLHEIDVLDKDIIVTGGQSGCVPYDLFSYNSILIPQVAYMYGINPDAVILCVAIDDEEEYINRTIDFIESSCNTDVVALMLFPVMYIDYAIGQFKKVDISNTVSYKEKLQEMERLYKRPVLEFSQDGIAKCIDCIIEFLGD